MTRDDSFVDEATCVAYREGMQKQMENIEKDISSLWKKWDKVIFLLVANLAGLVVAVTSIWLR